MALSFDSLNIVHHQPTP